MKTLQDSANSTAADPDTADASATETGEQTADAQADVIDVLASRFSDAEQSADEEAEPETEEEEAQADPEAEEGSEEQEAEADESEPSDEAEEKPEEEEAEEEAEEESEDSEDVPDLKKLDPKTREVVTKILSREMGKVRAKKREAEAKAAELETSLASVRQEAETIKARAVELEAAKVVPMPTATDPLSQFTTAEALTRLENDNRAFRRWATQNPDGGTCPLMRDDDGKPVELNAHQVRNLIANVDDDLDVNIPRRRAYLAENAKYDEQVNTLFPQLKEPHHELSLAVNDVLKNAPELKRFPGARMGAVYYELGRRLVEQHQGKAWEVATRKPAPATPAASKRIPVKPERFKPGPVPAAQSPARVNKSAPVRNGSLQDQDVTDVLASRFG